MKRDELFRVWYNNYLGTKSESFAYDAWCAACGQRQSETIKGKVMKSVSVLNGFTNKREAIESMAARRGELLLVEVIHNGGLPVTPIAYFVLDQDALDTLQETLR